jgi:hypothetical protein
MATHIIPKEPLKAQEIERRKETDWRTPQAMAIPKGGFFKDNVEQGRYGPIFPKTPACYGFSVIAKVIPGMEDHLYRNAKVMEKAIADNPETLSILKAHYLRWLTFNIKGDTYLMYQAIFDTDFDKYCEDASYLFGKTGIRATFEALEGWPADYATNPASIVKFFRDHQCPSFLEFSEHPYVTCDEIKKALELKATFSQMLDLMQ